uniref:helix-turn-helix transcriptional regulator n=1 Tax=Cohnella xylanilytica TaxID=557555 RepID=UPI0028930C99|nr:LuxR C-terminal-related transcriptional regulator [Cohnella xylanilytica]
MRSWRAATRRRPWPRSSLAGCGRKSAPGRTNGCERSSCGRWLQTRRGEKAETVPLLIEALERAEPGGYLRIFLDEGPLLVPLLSEAAIRGTLPGYVAKLMASRESERKGNSRPSAAVSGSGSLHAAASGLMVEPLTPRELEVLRLSAQGLSNREIGERLFLALDTVKGHNRRIYGKLQVKRRTEAIALARKLGFIE